MGGHWRDGWVVKNPSYSSKVPRFNFQHIDSQLSIATVPVDHTDTHTYRQNPIHIKKKKNF